VENKKVLITGGAGFIGSPVSEELVNSIIKISGMKKKLSQICEKHRHKYRNTNQGMVDISKTKEKLDFKLEYLVYKKTKKTVEMILI